MVSALVENSVSKFPTKRRFETSLHNEYRDPKSQRPNVDAIHQYPSGHSTATFRTTLRKNEDDLGAKISDSVAQTTQTNAVGSLGYKFHPGQSSTGVSRPTIDRRKVEGDSMVDAKAGGGSCTYSKPFKNANQAKYMDALTSLTSMSKTQPSISLMSPRIEHMKSQEDPIAAVAAKCSHTLVQPLNNAAQSKQINAVNLQALVSVPEYVATRYPRSRNHPVKPDFPVVLGARNSVSLSKHSKLAKGKSIAEEHIEEVNDLKDAKLFREELQGENGLHCTLKKNGHKGCSEYIVGQDFNGTVTIPSTNGNKVRDALSLFKVIITKLSKEKENKSRVEKASVYLEAAMLMKKQQQWVNTKKQFGSVSGVNIGDKFQFRAELVIIGLHYSFQCGIDYTKEDGQLLATSIVSSGRYGNDMESSDVLIYTGQGGNPIVRNKRLEDQTLERGNRALYNSMFAKNQVRVIRGLNFGKKNKYLPKYIYDGLYTVDKFWQNRGQFGKMVFKFQLKRIPGQPMLTQSLVVEQSELTWSKLNNSKNSKEDKGWSLNDMSQGKEKIPIRVVNTIDNEKLPSFKYMSNMIYPEWCKFSLPSGCDCFDGCSEKCPCALKNGGEFAFNNNGALIKTKPLVYECVYECGPSCKCSSACSNRVSQHGIRIQLEVFKTKSKGWGVRSRNYIPSGSFICEYVGELLQDKDAEARIDKDEYLFDIGDRDDDDSILLESESSSSNVMDDGGFTIDAAQYGNVARFVNHSCSPNLYAQDVLYDHDDRRAPHIMFFSAKNIPPLHELTYNYNYVMGNICDSTGNVKIKKCYCGSGECKGRMY